MLNKKSIYIKGISMFLMLWLVCSLIMLSIDIGLNGGNPPAMQVPSEPNDSNQQQPEAKPPIEDESEGEKPPIVEKQYLVMIKAKVDGLQIRSKPTASSASLGAINKNDLVVLTIPQSTLFPLNDTSGKANSERFIEVNSQSSLDSDEINLCHSERSEESRRMAERASGWYETRYKNQTAYISASEKYTEIVKFEMSVEKINKILQQGLNLLGTKYVYGAQRYHWGNGILNKNFSISAFDCSSFTQYIYYKSNMVLLQTTSRLQSTQGTRVNGELKVGDVMFFTNSDRAHLSGVERVGHVGIYFGDNYILHTASDYAVVEPISSERWKNFIHAQRVV